MKLFVETSPIFFVEENAILDAFFNEGLDFLILNKPNSNPLFCERLLTLLNKRWRNRIIVNEHFYLKDEFDLKGIHLDELHKELPRGYSGFYTRSCNTIEEIDYWKRRCQYVITPKLDEELTHRYVAAKVLCDKVIANEIKNIDDVKKYHDMGFGGVVASNAIWNQFDAYQSVSYKQLIDFFKKLHKACE